MDHVTVDGVRLRYRTTGSGPDVLLLHGIGRSLHDWDEQHELLADRHRVTSVDLPGFGESEPASSANTIESMATSVLAAMTALGIDTAHVVGNSLGGAVAMQVAVLAPDRARSLELASSAGFGRTVTPTLRLLAIRPLGRRLLNRVTDKAIYDAERGLYVNRDLVTQERLDRGMRFARRAHGTDVMLQTLSSLGTIWGVRPRWRRRLLAEVAGLDLPVLVLWGEKDLILPVAHADTVATALPTARLVRLPETGHLPQVERAEDFARLVQDFWAENTDDGATTGATERATDREYDDQYDDEQETTDR